MPQPSFMELLARKQRLGRYVCVGLDPDYERIPEFIRTQHQSQGEAVLAFLKPIIERTRFEAAMFKLNRGCYDRIKAGRPAEWARKVVDFILRLDPLMPVCWDGKFGDIADYNLGYVESSFYEIGAGAVTLNPYVGGRGLSPFLKHRDRGCFVLCRTSDPGSAEFQKAWSEVSMEEVKRWRLPYTADHSGRAIRYGSSPIMVYERVAHSVSRDWNRGRGNCGLTASALDVESLARIRQIAPNCQILVLGVGRQGGKVEEVVPAAKRKKHGGGFVINSSDDIVYAYERFGVAPERFMEAAESAAEGLNNDILTNLTRAS